jgi:hypothetical protein
MRFLIFRLNPEKLPYTPMNKPNILLVFIALGALVYFSKPNVVSQTPPAIDSTLTERLTRLESTLPPVGAIIAYTRTNAIPENWVMCDGSDLPPVPKTSPDLYQQLQGKAPDLTDRFLRGGLKVLELGGAASLTISGETFRDGNHDHGLAHQHELGALTTGPIANEGAPISNDRRYLTLHASGSWSTDQHLGVDGGAANGEGQHRHELHRFTGEATRTRTDTDGAHSHGFRGTLDALPEYAVVRWIIRIR